MQVLVIEAPTSIDQKTLRALHWRGYQVTTTATAKQALQLIGRTEFDGILVDIPASNADDFGLEEIRRFAQTSAVALMTTASIESLIQAALAEKSIELCAERVLIGQIDRLPQPSLLVLHDALPGLTDQIRAKGLRSSTATTLQFVMNLLVDGWCQLVLLDADIPDLNSPGQVAIFHQLKAKHLAILASALPSAPLGVAYCRKPETANGFIALFEQMAENRASPCGLSESHGRQVSTILNEMAPRRM